MFDACLQAMEQLGQVEKCQGWDTFYKETSTIPWVFLMMATVALAAYLISFIVSRFIAKLSPKLFIVELVTLSAALLFTVVAVAMFTGQAPGLMYYWWEEGTELKATSAGPGLWAAFMAAVCELLSIGCTIIRECCKRRVA